MLFFMCPVWKGPLNLSNEMSAYQYFHTNIFPEEVRLPFELLLKKPSQ